MLRQFVPFFRFALAGIVTKTRFSFSRFGRKSFHSSAPQALGGYIEEAQLTLFGLDIYQDLHGTGSVPPHDFVVPEGDESWPCNLWGYMLRLHFTAVSQALFCAGSSWEQEWFSTLLHLLNQDIRPDTFRRAQPAET